jgi:hypothetical protein
LVLDALNLNLSRPSRSSDESTRLARGAVGPAGLGVADESVDDVALDYIEVTLEDIATANRLAGAAAGSRAGRLGGRAFC